MQELEKILEEIEQEEKEYMKIDFGNEYNAGIKDMAEMAKKIIRKHMNDGWTSVEERLPAEGERVLVWYEYFRYGDYNCMQETYGIGWQYDGHFSGDVSGTLSRCIAWRPLPSPYSPERSEE